MLYRAASFFALLWGQRSDADGGRFGLFSPRAFALITWLPLRVTARFFVIVGDFEKAIYCCRNQADKWPASELGSAIGIVLSSGAGALGI